MAIILQPNPTPTPTTTDLLPAITTAAGGPSRVSGDSGSVAQQPIKDQIAADQYAKSAQALAARPLGIRRVKLVPGNCADFGRGEWGNGGSW